MEEASYAANINDKQLDINKMLKQLKSMYESDIMKVPDCNDYLDNLDIETCINKKHSNVLVEDESNTEQVDEFIVDKITSDPSITSKKRNDCQSSSSISSTNLLKKCYKSQSASNVNSLLKKSLSKCTSSVACKVPFSFSTLYDGSDGRTSHYSLFQNELEDLGPSNSTPDDSAKYSKLYTQNNIMKNNLNKHLDNEVIREVEENTNFTPNEKTVNEITKKIFDFLEMKVIECINN